MEVPATSISFISTSFQDHRNAQQEDGSNSKQNGGNCIGEHAAAIDQDENTMDVSVPNNISADSDLRDPRDDDQCTSHPRRENEQCSEKIVLGPPLGDTRASQPMFISNLDILRIVSRQGNPDEIDDSG